MNIPLLVAILKSSNILLWEINIVLYHVAVFIDETISHKLYGVSVCLFFFFFFLISYKMRVH